MYQHKWNITHIDKIDVYIYPERTSPIYKLSANSDIYFLDKKTILHYDSTMSQKVWWGYFKVLDTDFSDTPLAFILVWLRTVWSVTRKDVLETTGIWCLLRDTDFWLFLSNKLQLNPGKLKRLDLCRDFAYASHDFIQTLQKSLVSKKITHCPISTSIHWVETLYIGARKNNSYKIIRIYNKILDSIEKGKSKFYGIDKDDKMTRVEIEFRRDKLKLTDMSIIFDQEILDQMFNHEICLNRYFSQVPNFKKSKYKRFFDQKVSKLNISSWIRDILITEQNKNFAIYWSLFKSSSDEMRAFSTICSYMKKLCLTGYDKDQLLDLLSHHLDTHLSDDKA